MLLLSVLSWRPFLLCIDGKHTLICPREYLEILFMIFSRTDKSLLPIGAQQEEALGLAVMEPTTAET